MGALNEESLHVVTSGKLSKMWRLLVTLFTKSFRYSCDRHIYVCIVNAGSASFVNRLCPRSELEKRKPRAAVYSV